MSLHIEGPSIYNGLMKKKILAVLFVLFVGISLLSAGSTRFVFAGLTQHAEIVKGFFPSYLMGGAGYSGISFLEGNKTEFQVLFGAGYNQRKLWQNPIDGSIIYEDPIIYDVVDLDWAFRLAQGFGDSPVGGKDLLTVTLSYEGQYEVAVDSLAKGKIRSNGGEFFVGSLDSYGVGDSYSGSIYPELNGDGRFLGAQLALSFKLDGMTDTIHTNDGFLVKADMKWGPKAMNSTLDGYADYFAISADIINAKTLYTFDRNGKTMLSIVLIDRLNGSYVTGDSIPAFIQGPNSLGRKVRGFNTYTYNTAFSCVNNFDIRFAGPFVGLDGVAPRVNLFFDIGYGTGKVMNTANVNSNVLSSFGFQAAATFFDFCDLGYQIAYLINGDNYAKGVGTNIAGSVTFFLDF